MSILTGFFSSFIRSLRDFTYYKEILNLPFFASVRFLYFTTVLALFINTLLLAITLGFFLPSLSKNIDAVQKRLSTLYPPDLVVIVNNGTIATNVSEPVIFDIPEMSGLIDKKHFLLIQTEAIPADYVDLDTLLLVTAEGVVYPDANGSTNSYRIEKAENFGDVRIDKEDYLAALTRLNAVFEMVSVMAPWFLISSVFIIPLFGSFILTVWRMFILILLTGIVYPVSMIFGYKYRYSRLYKMGLHGLVLPILLTLGLNIIGISIPLVFASSFLLWMVMVLSRIGDEPAKAL